MGEGVPRIFRKWSTTGFGRVLPPRFHVASLACHPKKTPRWLNQFPRAQINFRQRRLLAYAYCHGKTFSTAEYERIAEVDRDAAYREIRSMVKNGIVAPLKPKSRSYRIIEALTEADGFHGTHAITGGHVSAAHANRPELAIFDA
jgi:hypothetical protein